MKKRLLHFFSTLALASMVAGCTDWDMQALKKADLPEDPFANALASHYLRFAEEEASQFDWIDSQYFAQKGLQVAYGNPVQPEMVDSWKLPAATAEEARRMREALVQALVEGRSAEQPMAAASAIFGFDCWLEQSEEGWQHEHIARCRELFEQNLALLNAKEEPLPELAQPEEAPSLATQAYMVFFDFDSAVLTEQGKKVLAKVASELKSIEHYDVILSGHADRSGTDGYNLSLSKKRAEVVKKALMELGVKEPLMSAFPFGEKSPIVATANGKKEARNRRVEIVVAQ